MFHTPLSVPVSEKKIKARTPSKPIPQPVKEVKKMSIQFNRNERTDIDTKGFAQYLYHFLQVTEVQDKEISQCIISSPTMDAAIELFTSTQVRGAYYVDAVFDVELMGVDFNVDRIDKFVMVD